MAGGIERVTRRKRYFVNVEFKETGSMFLCGYFAINPAKLFGIDKTQRGGVAVHYTFVYVREGSRR